jgi:acyl-CoA thioesterase-1
MLPIMRGRWVEPQTASKKFDGRTASAIEDTGKQSYLAKHQPELKMKRRIWLGLLATFGMLFIGAAQAATVVALGASNTFGKGVSRSQAYPAQLEALLRTKGLNARVINAGINGDTTGGMLARLDRIVPKGTSVVVLQPGGNDRRKSAPDKTSEIQAAMGIKVVLLPNGMLRGLPHQPDGQHLTPEGYHMLAEQLVGQVAGALRR